MVICFVTAECSSNNIAPKVLTLRVNIFSPTHTLNQTQFIDLYQFTNNAFIINNIYVCLVMLIRKKNSN
jgi:hypothetical protein